MQRHDIPAFQVENISVLAFEVNVGEIGFFHKERKGRNVHETVSGELVLEILYVD